MANPPKFLTDEKGLRIAVVLDIAEYERMVEELEELDELECIREYDAAKASGESAIPFEQAMVEAGQAIR